MILDVSGSIGIAHARVPLASPLDQRHYVKLKYLHLDLPLLDAFADAVTVNAEAFTIPETTSVEQLVDELDALVQNGLRVCYVWYSGHEFELCVGTQNITLSAAFAGILKLPTTLLANQCYSSSVYEKSISAYSHFSVVVKGARGMWDGQGYDEQVAKVRRDGVIDAHKHFFTSQNTELLIDVYAVTRQGELVVYSAPEVWSIGLEYGE